MGNGVNETRAYDARFRVTNITDGARYTVTIGSYAPNGDILAANDSVNGNWTYGYDAFNRLVSANQNSGQAVYSYIYDRFGNRWQQNGPHSMQLSFTGANNRMDGYSYDAAGNLLNDGTTAYTYDAENRIISAVNSTNGTSTYVYNASGQRVRKTTAGTGLPDPPGTFDFLYDLVGHAMTQLTSGGGWYRSEIYAGGRHLATYASSTTYFVHSDWLGTERARSSASGAAYQTCTSLPFGDWLSCSAADHSFQHFTGKEHDYETGLENFGARYDSSSLGRFMSPDWSSDPEAVPYAKLSNPQSLNLYAYVQNNPINAVDLDGHGYAMFSTQNASGGGGDLPMSDVDQSSLDGLGVSVTLILGFTVNGVTSSWSFTTTPVDAQATAQQWTGSQGMSKEQLEQVRRAIEFQKDARAAYQKFGPTAKSVKELEASVDKSLEEKYGPIGTAGTTDSSGNIEVKPDPNPYTRNATRQHERVHQQAVREGIAKYGKDTPAYYKWYLNPQRWAENEVKAYSAGIRYLEQSLREMNAPQ